MKQEVLSMKKKSAKPKLISFFIFLTAFLLSVFGFYHLDRSLSRIAAGISEAQLQNTVLTIIDDALSTAIQSSNISAEDFLLNHTNDGIAANTLLINQFCTKVSEELTKSFQVLEQEKIPVPIGALTGTEYLANFGPSLTFTLQPAGFAQVDYETALEESGINQMHFKIWLNIAAKIKVVNPLHTETFPIERKIMLIDLVFGGDVPNEFFQFQTKG